MKLLTLLLLFFSLSSTYAQSLKATPKLDFKNAIIYTPLKGAIATAGYAEIKNLTDKKVHFSVKKAAPFKVVESHQTLEKDGKMSMQKVDSFSVDANSVFLLKQGGNHIMLFEPEKEIKDGEKILVDFLVDEKTQSIEFTTVPRIKK